MHTYTPGGVSIFPVFFWLLAGPGLPSCGVGSSDLLRCVLMPELGVDVCFCVKRVFIALRCSCALCSSRFRIEIDDESSLTSLPMSLSSLPVQCWSPASSAEERILLCEQEQALTPEHLGGSTKTTASSYSPCSGDATGDHLSVPFPSCHCSHTCHRPLLPAPVQNGLISHLYISHELICSKM